MNDVYEVFAEYTNTQNMSLGDLKEESAKEAESTSGSDQSVI